MPILIITVLSALAAWIAAYVAWQAAAESRINSAVNYYVDLGERGRDSGISALLKSNVIGMSEQQLKQVIRKIEAATRRNPLGSDLEQVLKLNRVPIGKFLEAVANQKVAPPTLNLTQLIETLKPHKHRSVKTPPRKPTANCN